MITAGYRLLQSSSFGRRVLHLRLDCQFVVLPESGGQCIAVLLQEKDRDQIDFECPCNTGTVYLPCCPGSGVLDSMLKCQN